MSKQFKLVYENEGELKGSYSGIPNSKDGNLIEREALEGKKPVTPPTPTATINITENGEYDVAEFGTANVDVEGFVPSGEVSITENGIADVSRFATANVNVPTGVFPAGDLRIEENGEGIDVRTKASVTVAVPTYPEPTGKAPTITTNGTNINIKDYATVDVAVPNPLDNLSAETLYYFDEVKDPTEVNLTSGLTYQYNGGNDFSQVVLPSSAGVYPFSGEEWGEPLSRGIYAIDDGNYQQEYVNSGDLVEFIDVHTGGSASFNSVYVYDELGSQTTLESDTLYYCGEDEYGYKSLRMPALPEGYCFVRYDGGSSFTGITGVYSIGSSSYAECNVYAGGLYIFNGGDSGEPFEEVTLPSSGETTQFEIDGVTYEISVAE